MPRLDMVDTSNNNGIMTKANWLSMKKYGVPRDGRKAIGGHFFLRTKQLRQVSETQSKPVCTSTAITLRGSLLWREPRQKLRWRLAVRSTRDSVKMQ